MDDDGVDLTNEGFFSRLGFVIGFVPHTILFNMKFTTLLTNLALGAGSSLLAQCAQAHDPTESSPPHERQKLLANGILVWSP